MTTEQAIKELKSDRELYEGDIVYAGDGTPDGNLMLALDMGIAALERQKQEKIIIVNEDGRQFEDYVCPQCKGTLQQKNKDAKRITIYKYKHCLYCGQALDWSDTDEMSNCKSKK